MSLALKWGDGTVQNGGFLFFDAVTVYTRSSRGKVTKHPISLGSKITDHFIKDNDTIRISAVISGADISSNSYLIQDLDGNNPYNVLQPPDAVSVNSTDQSVLKKFIPDSIGQFLPDSTPEIVVADARIDMLEQIRFFLESLTSGVAYNDKTKQFDPNIQVVQLFEYVGSSLSISTDNLVVTDLRFKEDVNTGYALYFDMTLEQVTFASLKKTTIPKNIVKPLSKKAEPKSSKGKVGSTPQTAGADAPKDVDSLRQARVN